MPYFKEQAQCKVKLNYNGFKYNGKCYNCCDPDCLCPHIVIMMNINDARHHVKMFKAELLPDTDTTPLTEPGNCCGKAAPQIP